MCTVQSRNSRTVTASTPLTVDTHRFAPCESFVSMPTVDYLRHTACFSCPNTGLGQKARNPLAAAAPLLDIKCTHREHTRSLESQMKHGLHMALSSSPTGSEITHTHVMSPDKGDCHPIASRKPGWLPGVRVVCFPDQVDRG